MTKPYTIKIFVPAGDPEGIRIIEKSNWSGVGLVIPRALFGEAKLRKEMARTGVRISVHPDHSFRSKSITHFARSRSPVWEQVDHPFRSKPITRFG